MHYLLVSGCSEGCSRRQMKANSSKSTYNIILCNKKEIISQHLQHFTGGYPPGISSDPPGFYRTYLNAVEVVQGDLLFHWCLYKVIYASWIHRKSSGLFKCRCMMCVHSLMVEIRGVAPVAGVDVNPKQHTAAGLKAGLEGSRLKLGPGWKEPWEILAGRQMW